MKVLSYVLLSVVLVALFATVGYAWTINDSAGYGSPNLIASYSYQPVDWDGHYNWHHRRYYPRYYRTYPVYPYYSYYGYPYYYDPYYYGPGVSVNVPYFSFGFGF